MTDSLITPQNVSLVIPSSTQSHILQEFLKERSRQDKKFSPSPRCLHSTVWLSVITEELGEVARAMLDSDSSNYEEELVQLGACCMAALEDYYEGTQSKSLDDVGCNILYKKDPPPITNEIRKDNACVDNYWYVWLAAVVAVSAFIGFILL